MLEQINANKHYLLYFRATPILKAQSSESESEHFIYLVLACAMIAQRHKDYYKI